MGKMKVDAALAAFLMIALSLVLLMSCSRKTYLLSGNIARNLEISYTGSLTDVFAEAGISAEYVLLIASDGTAVFLTERSLPHLQVSYRKGKYNTVSEILPPVAGLYDLQEISVYNSHSLTHEYQTLFSYRLMDFEFLGESSMNGHTVRKYKLKSAPEL